MYKWFLLILLWAASSSLIPSQTIVKTLPGYPGPLPFKLETGYIGVGEDEDVQLFYFFVESEGNPEVDPLIIWLAGGPGCSNLHAFFFEIGPLKILNGNYIDDVPALKVDPNSWTKLANIIYLDGPTLTGYSYTTTSEAARSSDTLSASQTTEFIRKGSSEVSEKSYGYMAGNPLTNKSGDINSRFEFAYQMALISKDLFESTKEECNGEYAEANDKNMLCISRINEVNKRVSDINMSQILEPICGNSTSKLLPTVNQIRMRKQRSVRENPIMIVHAQPSVKDAICNVDYFYAMLWANNRNVMKALNVRKGRVTEENLCNMDMKYDYGYTSLPLYEFNVQSSVEHHEELKSNWDAWYSNGQVAGFKTTYAHDNYSLVFATVKGGGHTVPQYKPKQCFDMVKRWFAHESI
ncbi:Peptidase S10, serine carboxypeptidase [Artemisia annua]|uniref:Peptidase S10, serine carboxypeptidase n=1 Tax=Artemisia annua TaxID=35608 RepID=A0A2U1PRS8_ARTAN|nr:Peptidase S10, serine carboxypeptidase [Artemisia annua]